MEFNKRGMLCDLVKGVIYPAEVFIRNARIHEIREISSDERDLPFIMPGLVDAHIHIESSLLNPLEFWRLAITHGTLATVSDPHEIANVLGLDGVRYMIDCLKDSPFLTCWGAPSCVPATNEEIETSGAKFGITQISELMNLPEVGYLSEVMNFPAVLSRDPHLMSFIRIAREAGKPVDGHAPGLRGHDAKVYAEAGISTDHECFTLEEALDKLNSGMKIIIREGSAAKNYCALKSLINTHPEQVMLCSDDKHPHELQKGHINLLVSKAVRDGFNPVSVLRAASLNAVRHYNLPVGQLQKGDTADFIIVESLESMKILEVFLRGEKLAEKGRSLFSTRKLSAPNNFNAGPVTAEMLQIPAKSGKIRVISVIDGQLLTGETIRDAFIKEGFAVSNPEENLLKIVVVNRYHDAKPATGFCENTGIKTGAIASSVAHDSHNIVAVGASDDDIAEAINLVISRKGGLSLSHGSKKKILPLPVAGLMSDLPAEEVVSLYEELHETVESELGSDLHDAMMMLSFLALPVIGALKMTDKGLFSTDRFTHVPLFVEE